MKLLPVLVTLVLTLALAYYVYTPVPDAIQEPWKLMAVHTMLRTTRHLCTFHAWLTSGNAAGSVRKFEQTMEALEKAMEGPEASGGVTPGVKISDTTFAGVPVRVFEPPAGGEGHLRRGLMYIHGGGWTRGGAKTKPCDKVNKMLSDELNAVVVSVEYRMYPDVYFPEPYLDCLAAAKHFLSPEILARYAIDPERVAVSGDSSGGNLAAAVSLEISADDTMNVKFSAQALVYPVLQALDFNTPSYLQNQHVPILYRDVMVKFWLQYLNADLSLDSQWMANNHSSTDFSDFTPELRARLDWTALLSEKYKKSYKPVVMDKGSKAGKDIPGLLDVRASPLLAAPEALAKCPRAYIATCEFDVLRDDGLMYARRLQDAGITVTSVHYEDGFHGCFSLISWPFDFDVGRRVVRDYIDWLKNNL